MWLRRHSAVPSTLSKGACFRRTDSQGVVELAKVIAVVADGAGVSHVQFSLAFPSFGEGAIEYRTLAIDRFCTLYRDPVVSAGIGVSGEAKSATPL